MPYQEHCRHIEEQINLSCDVCELGSRVTVLLQVKGEEQIRLVVSGIIIGMKIQRTLPSCTLDFIIRNLKKEFDGLPALEQGLVFAEFPITFVELGKNRIRRVVEIEGLLALITERAEQANGGSTQVRR